MSVARIGLVLVAVGFIFLGIKLVGDFYHSKYFEKDWLEDKKILEARSKRLCGEKNMVYAGYEMTGWRKWEAICVAESPLDVKTFPVKTG